MSFFSEILKKLTGHWLNKTCVSIKVIKIFFAINFVPIVLNALLRALPKHSVYECAI